MERFQKIKSNRRKLDIDSICRFCGLENEEKYNILELNEDGVEFSVKLSCMLGITAARGDKMPPNVCCICMDKINDFYEFRLMALNTEKQTREAIGLPLIAEKPKPNIMSLQTKPAVVRLIDLKHSKGDELLIQKALQRLNQSDHTNIPSTSTKRIDKPLNAATTQPPNKKSRKDISCNICSEASFSYLSDLQDHQMKVHLPLVSKYACGSCRETFEQLSDYKEHENMHTKKKLPYTCYFCSYPFSKLRDFSKHMTNYNCKAKEKLAVTVDDIKCFQCKKKHLTQNLFEWHGCFLKTRGKCTKCGQFFQKKKMLFKHYVLCERTFITPESAKDPNRKSIKPEVASTPGTIINITTKTKAVRKKTVPLRRMTTVVKAEKEVNLPATNVSQHLTHDEDDDDDNEYTHFEDDITYDNFGSDDDDEGNGDPHITSLEPVVELQEQAATRIINIKPERSNEQSVVRQHSIGGNSIDPQIIRSIKREQGNKQATIVSTAHKPSTPVPQQQKNKLALRIKAEKGVNEQPVVQVLNPLAIGKTLNSATTSARKKVFKIPQALAVQIKKEKMHAGYGDQFGRDEAEPDPDEEKQMENSLELPSDITAIKQEKMDKAYGDDVLKKGVNSSVASNTVKINKQFINPMALAMMRDKSVTNGSEGNNNNSLVIASVTSMSTNDDTSENGVNKAMPPQGQEKEEDAPNISINQMEDVDIRADNNVVNAQMNEQKMMIEIPAEFSESTQDVDNFNPSAVLPTDTPITSNMAPNNERTVRFMDNTAAALNSNEDELDQLLEKYGEMNDDNLQDSDLQDLLKFD